MRVHVAGDKSMESMETVLSSFRQVPKAVK